MNENGRVTLWRIRETNYSEGNVRFRKKSGHIALGFCMTSHGSGSLMRIATHMNSEEYIQILSNVVLPYIAETFPGIPYVNFIEDNSEVHRVIVQDWLAAQPNIRTLDWSAKSPDLNECNRELLGHYTRTGLSSSANMRGTCATRL